MPYVNLGKVQMKPAPHVALHLEWHHPWWEEATWIAQEVGRLLR